MDDSSVFEMLLETARQLGLRVRHAPLGGGGGGLAIFNKQRHLFVDLDADPAEQLNQTVQALRSMPELANIYLRPDVRRLLEEET